MSDFCAQFSAVAVDIKVKVNRRVNSPQELKNEAVFDCIANFFLIKTSTEFLY